MSLTPSTMLELGTAAPFFRLPDTEGNIVSLDDFVDAKGLLVVFMCNHCPYVIHVREELTAIGRDYQAKGIAMVGINANDSSSHPADSYEKMKEEVKNAGYTFPYLHDETQETAKTYNAACTPDIYLFDQNKKLVYRGQIDDARPGNNVAVTGADLRAALDALLAGQAISAEQKPSMGCNIKWKAGNEPSYF